MLSIALRSRWLVASFFVKTIIKLLVFLFAATVLSSTACGIWVAMFWIDMILVKFLRDEHRLKHHELPPFSFNGCVYEPFVNNIRECIALCLASDAISAEWTAEILDEMLPANRYLKFPNIFAPSSVLFVWRLWETIVQFAAQIPFNHYKQDKLVELIVALSKRPTVLVRHRDTLLRFWDAMPEYNVFVAVYGNMFFFADDWRHHGDMAHQTNLMAFLARVQSTGLPYGLMFGATWSFHAALEEKRHDALPWAAFWIEHCGEYLWWFISQESNNGIIFNKCLWTRYMSQFGRLAGDAENGRFVRMLAQDAFRTMTRLTGSTPNPRYDNVGQQRWEATLAREGPEGVFDEPIAPDIWQEADEEEDDDGDIYEGEYMLELEGEEDPNGFHPLRPPGGFLLYSAVTEEDESKIARAA